MFRLPHAQFSFTLSASNMPACYDNNVDDVTAPHLYDLLMIL